MAIFPQLCRRLWYPCVTFFLSFMLIFGRFCAKELWQQVMPIFPPLCQVTAPCAALVWAVYLMVLTANNGNRYAHQISQVQAEDNRFWSCLRIWVRSRYKTTDFDAVLTISRGSQCPAGILPALPTYSTLKVEVNFSPVYATPCSLNQNGTCHFQLTALLMPLTANYVNRYAHQMGQSLSVMSLELKKLKNEGQAFHQLAGAW